MRVKNDHRGKFQKKKFTAMIILHSHLQQQFKNESFHILLTKKVRTFEETTKNTQIVYTKMNLRLATR